MRCLLVALAFLFAFAPVPGGTTEGPAAPVANVARVHRAVSTEDPVAQAAFDDGLTLLYAFNPEEARRSFQRALQADPALAMAWWGLAMSYGPNINKSYDVASQRAGRAAIAKAQGPAEQATPVETALVAAAAKRFALTGSGDADRSAHAYRDAMNAVADAYPSDDDVQTLAAEAEMDVHPWDYFSADGTPTPGTHAILTRLETVLRRNPAHIGANHFLIHAYEESPHPENALPAARRLAALTFEPAAEHLAHMPAHTFMRVGDYRAAGEANAKALALYRAYLASGAAGHADYLGHDCSFGVDAFMMAGDYQRAHEIAASCDSGSNNLAARVDLRFRRYDALAADSNAAAFVAGMLAAHEGRLDAAQSRLSSLRKDQSDVATISADVLEAAIDAGQGKREAQVATLERAVTAEDALGYAEPPRFWYPVRESLGGALFAAGHFAEAERAFRADLARNPENPRSLFGLAAALTSEGRADEADATKKRFERAWPEDAAGPNINDL